MIAALIQLAAVALLYFGLRCRMDWHAQQYRFDLRECRDKLRIESLRALLKREGTR